MHFFCPVIFSEFNSFFVLSSALPFLFFALRYLSIDNLWICRASSSISSAVVYAYHQMMHFTGSFLLHDRKSSQMCTPVHYILSCDCPFVRLPLHVFQFGSSFCFAHSSSVSNASSERDLYGQLTLYSNFRLVPSQKLRSTSVVIGNLCHNPACVDFVLLTVVG